ncbi:NUDIX domain-containing protein [Candidatus Pacearchaeota archaeon]|nr:NUDIX domain-containing protein [Candidatus Pacearchaeota archaeon]
MEKDIIKLFLNKEKLKFNDIEKTLQIRSNKLSYHLQKLIDKKVLEKNNGNYKLSKSSECLIPYISDQFSPLPVILIHIGDKDSYFLINRDKRPFQNKLALPGGRILVGESINQAVKRIMKEKYKLNCQFKKVCSISLEHVKSEDKRLHSFLLIFVSAITKDKITLVNITKNKSRIISSDYKLLKNNSDLEIKIKNLITKA